jgi:hypothetical protein
MLAKQFRVWASYAEAVKSQIEIVLVDDGSPDHPAVSVPRPDGLPSCRLYRVLVDLPWHQHGARNLAASEAEARWLFLSDMDHVLPAASVPALLDRLSSTEDALYTFHRLDAPHLRPKVDTRGHLHPHPNTYLLTKARFWAIGGYDEDCVGYGTDGFFRDRLRAVPTVHLDDVPVIRYPRDVIADASTVAPDGSDPRRFRDSARQTSRNQEMLAEKAIRGEGPSVLGFPWMREVIT